MPHDRLVGRYRLPHVNGQPSQARAADRAIDDLTGDANERALLRVIVDHADGAGVCLLTMARLTQLARISSGKYPERTVQRVRTRVEVNGLLEVYPSRRDPAKYSQNLPQRARQGSGPNWYRLGAAVRAAAGYIEVDMAEVYGGANAAPQIGSTSPPTSRCVIPETQRELNPEPVTPEIEPLSPPTLQGNGGDPAAGRVTPRTKNGKALIEEGWLVPSRSEGTLEIAIDFSLFSENEAAFIADCEKLVAAGHAMWVKSHSANSGETS